MAVSFSCYYFCSCLLSEPLLVLILYYTTLYYSFLEIFFKINSGPQKRTLDHLHVQWPNKINSLQRQWVHYCQRLFSWNKTFIFIFIFSSYVSNAIYRFNYPFCVECFGKKLTLLISVLRWRTDFQACLLTSDLDCNFNPYWLTFKQYIWVNQNSATCEFLNCQKIFCWTNDVA